MNQIVQHSLKERFFQINAVLPKNQAGDVGLNLADELAQGTLLGRADNSFQEALRNKVVEKYFRTKASDPVFYYGKRASSIS